MPYPASSEWRTRALLAIGGLALTVAAIALLPSLASAKTSWLCRPGVTPNPCKTKMKTTVISPTGAIEGVRKYRPSKRRPVDCFYVYPTVSNQAGPNADLTIDPEQRNVALSQAARYSQVCKVFAPMYPQVTVPALFGEQYTPEFLEIAYAGVLKAWRTYLRKYNRRGPKGTRRGVVLIGHSQGTHHLTRLISEQIDPDPKLRKGLVSALLLGGSVEVAKGRGVDGSFNHVRACRSARQVGCAVAFVTFNAPVPAGAVFGRSSDPSREILCTNPASLRGGAGKLDTIYPSKPSAGLSAAAVGLPRPEVSTPWYELKGAYRGRCSAADDANVLQITPVGGAPVLSTSLLGPAWGLHIIDANIALGNLTDLVRKQIGAYERTAR